MKPEELIEHLTEEKNESNLCVVLRSGEEGLEALLVADEKGRWSIPGGHAKDGETNAEAAKREVKEETGLDVTDILRRLLIELPEQPVGTDESWKRTRPDTTNVQGIKLITKPDIKYTIVGNEKINGFDCVKISVDGTSSQYGTGTAQGMEIVVDGTVKTKGTMFFAPKQGVLVSVESTSTGDSNVSGTGEQMFTRTQTSSSVSKIVLVK